MIKDKDRAKHNHDCDQSEKILRETCAAVDQEFGKGSVMLGHTIVQDVATIPTGSLRLDVALGVGGVPRGRIVEIFGPEASGKTTLALEIIKNVQRSGGRAMFIDVENALDAIYARAIGVDIDKLFISQPNCGEQAMGIAERFCKTNVMDIIVLDSVAGLTPRAELEGDIGENQMGAQARLMSSSLRKLAPIVNRTKTCLLFTNQLREKIGIMFGNPETTPGGRALKYWASVRIDIRRKETVKDGDVAVANVVRVKVQKNKVAPPFRCADFKITFGKGIARGECILDVAVQSGVVQMDKGHGYSYKTQRLGCGVAQAAGFLDANLTIAREIETATRALVFKRAVIVSRPDQDVPVE
jgi:recombination protein RecA